MLPDVFALLNVPAIRELLGDPPRIYRHGAAPQAPNGPTGAQAYVTWFVVSGVPENHLDGTPPIDAFSIQVDCWSSNTGAARAAVETLARAVRDQIETEHHIIAIPIDTQDIETQRYRISLTFTWWAPRS